MNKSLLLILISISFTYNISAQKVIDRVDAIIGNFSFASTTNAKDMNAVNKVT